MAKKNFKNLKTIVIFTKRLLNYPKIPFQTKENFNDKD